MWSKLKPFREKKNKILTAFNLFLANSPILYPMKTPEN